MTVFLFDLSPLQPIMATVPIWHIRPPSVPYVPVHPTHPARPARSVRTASPPLFHENMPIGISTPQNVHAVRYLARELVSRRRSPQIHEERPADACLCRSPTTLCLLAALCRTGMQHLLAALCPLQVLSPPPRVRLCVCVSAHTASEQHSATSPRRNAIPAACFPGIGTG